MEKEKDKLNWFAISIMLLGILLSVVSHFFNLDLLFTGGFMFGVGLSRLLEDK